MRVGSLFSGIGGFDLAAKWIGWETKWYAEIDSYAAAVMREHFPKARNMWDVESWQPDWAADRVDVICGGFPCQDVSQAQQNGQGLEGDKSGRWKHMWRTVECLRPRWVVVENVEALRYGGRGLATVLSDLTAIGYDAEWCTIRAADFGAPHQRARIWVVAYPNSNSKPNVSINAKTFVLPEPNNTIRKWPDPPRGLSLDDGVPNRMARLARYGNAIVPQIAYWIFQQIERREG